MFGKTLLLAAVFGTVAYVVLQTQQKTLKQDRTVEKTDKSRWENEGGAPSPSAHSALHS